MNTAHGEGCGVGAATLAVGGGATPPRPPKLPWRLIPGHRPSQQSPAGRRAQPPGGPPPASTVAAGKPGSQQQPAQQPASSAPKAASSSLQLSMRCRLAVASLSCVPHPHSNRHEPREQRCAQWCTHTKGRPRARRHASHAPTTQS